MAVFGAGCRLTKSAYLCDILRQTVPLGKMALFIVAVFFRAIEEMDHGRCRPGC